MTGIKFFDIGRAPKIQPGGRKRILVNADQFHVWIHGDWPGFKGNMHKHTADEFFYCVCGACTFHFPGGAKQELTPGTCVVIPKGELYQIENTGGEYLGLLGARAEADGMERWSANGGIADSDTKGGRLHKSAKPRIPGKLD